MTNHLTPIELEVRDLDNMSLAHALEFLHHERGARKRALVAEAARRLRWADVYERHGDVTLELPKAATR